MSFLGLFGGDSSSSSSTKNVNTTQTVYNTGSGPSTTQNLNNVQVSPNGTLKLETTDYGAVQAGLALSQSALNANNDALGQAFGQSQQVVDKTLSIASQNQVSESAQFQQTLIKLGIAAAVAIVAVMVLRK